MSKEDLKKYYEILELSPEATAVEVKNAYLHLKKLYSSDSMAIFPLAEEMTETRRQEILAQIEEAYIALSAVLGEDIAKATGAKKHIAYDMEILGKKPDREAFVESVLKEMGTVLKAEKLCKSYDHRVVVRDVDVMIKPGEIIALLGRNGAGKTTTFQMIVGLIKPDSGSIFLSSKDISRYSTHQRAESGITYLPQENSVFLKTTVENNLTMILELKGFKKEERKAIALQLLDELELLPLAKQAAHSLSGGERRKLEICRSLILDPKFLLLDEPFTGIDPLTIVELQKILLQLKYKGIGIILSDHNVRDTLRIADRAYIIDEGVILVVGSPQEIATNELAKGRFLGKDFRLGDEIGIYSS